MILETLRGIRILAETLAFAVIVVVIDTAEPFAGTFDTEWFLAFTANSL